MERAATIASSLEAEQESGNINRTPSMATLNEPLPYGTNLGSGPRCQDTILGDEDAQNRFETASIKSNDSPLSRVNTLGSEEDRMKLMELMKVCINYLMSPTIYTSCIKQYYTFSKVKTVNDDVRLQALVDGKKVIVNGASIRCDLILDDAK
nr:hypothetical protein [Tanacetum cinerariifolium]